MLRLLLMLAFSSLVLALAAGCSETPADALNESADSPFSALAPETASTTRPTPKTEWQPLCFDYENVQEIRSEYAANPVRAQDQYSSGMLCVQGRIDSISVYQEVHISLGEGWDFVLGPNTYPPTYQLPTNQQLSSEDESAFLEWENRMSQKRQQWAEWMNLNWWEWVKTLNAGDAIELECSFSWVYGPDDVLPNGTPHIEGCWLPSVLESLPPPTPVPVSTPAPSATPTQDQMATETALEERRKKGAPLISAFHEASMGGADMGWWQLNNNEYTDEYLTVYRTSTESFNIFLRLSCDHSAGDLKISFPGSGYIRSGRVHLYFQDSDGSEIRSFAPRDPQQVIDGMLLPGVVKMTSEFTNDRGQAVSYTFETAGFRAVHDILTDYCRPAADEVEATVAAIALKSPTATPVPSPTPTPVRTTWQQEWCSKRNNPVYGLRGWWNQARLGEGTDGTARLIVRCGGGTLVIGLHITRSDGNYPENRQGIAYAFEQPTETTDRRHHKREDLMQVQGGGGEGMIIVFPEAMVKDIAESFDRPFQAMGSPQRWLLLYFGAAGDDVGGWDFDVHVIVAGSQAKKQPLD